MRVWIDQDYCTGSGLCELIEPRVFAIGDNGLARVRAAEVPPGCEDEVRDAAESCPGGCIRLEPRPLSRTCASFLPAPRKPADRGNAFSTRSAEKTISRTILQTIADNLRYVQGRLNTGSHRINHFGTAARRQVMLMGASNTTMTRGPGVLLHPPQRFRLSNLATARRSKGARHDHT